jgi:hypothetical protein
MTRVLLVRNRSVSSSVMLMSNLCHPVSATQSRMGNKSHDMHTSKSAAVSDGMPALSSFRCSFNLAVSVTLTCISYSIHGRREPGRKHTLSTDTSSCSAMMVFRLLARLDMTEDCCVVEEYDDRQLDGLFKEVVIRSVGSSRGPSPTRDALQCRLDFRRMYSD